MSRIIGKEKGLLIGTKGQRKRGNGLWYSMKIENMHQIIRTKEIKYVYKIRFSYVGLVCLVINGFSCFK